MWWTLTLLFLWVLHLSTPSILGHFPTLMCFVLVEPSTLPLPIEVERGSFWVLPLGLVTYTYPVRCSSVGHGVWHKAGGGGTRRKSLSQQETRAAPLAVYTACLRGVLPQAWSWQCLLFPESRELLLSLPFSKPHSLAFLSILWTSLNSSASVNSSLISVACA